MPLLLKNVHVVDPSSSVHGQKVDLLVEGGVIQEVAKPSSRDAERVMDCEGLFVSPGWVDCFADYCEPGHEERETLQTGMDAAAAGGFTDVLLAPNTSPPITNKSVVEFVQKQAAHHPVDLHVIGAVSKNIEGKDLAEMMDMHHSGALAFSDGWSPVQDAGLMLKALEYVKAFDGTIVQIPIQASLSKGGLMNESEVSLRLGMSGIPAMAESLIVHRDLELLRYTDSKIHFSGVTTADAIRLIAAAKREGLAVSCSVTPHHLLFSDEELQTYDSLYKVAPPLRTEADRKALVAAVRDGWVDCISSHHLPQDWDAKAKEFEYAGTGMITQETCFAMLRKAIPELSNEDWVRLLAVRPREVFRLPKVTVEKGSPARLTLFQPDRQWVYRRDSKHSLGINSPFFEQTLTGKASILTEKTTT